MKSDAALPLFQTRGGINNLFRTFCQLYLKWMQNFAFFKLEQSNKQNFFFYVLAKVILIFKLTFQYYLLFLT